MSNIETLKPFQSGHDPRRNLNGRPKGSGNIKKQMEKLLEKEIGSGENKTTIKMLLAESIIKKAISGDKAMIKLVWEYLDGKPRRQRSRPHLDY